MQAWKKHGPFDLSYAYKEVRFTLRLFKYRTPDARTPDGQVVKGISYCVPERQLRHTVPSVFDLPLKARPSLLVNLP